MKNLRKYLLTAALVSSSAFMSPIATADTTATADSSDEGFYLTAGIGTGLETDVDGTLNGTAFTAKGRTTFAGGIGLGYDFDNSWRVETRVIRATANVDQVVIGGKTYNVDTNDSATGASISLEYDFENDSKITPFIGGSYGITWVDGNSTTGYGIDFGLSTPIADKVEFWGAVGLGFSSDESETINGNSVKTDGGTEWGFSTGLRIRL